MIDKIKPPLASSGFNHEHDSAPKRQTLPCPNPECEVGDSRPCETARCETCHGFGELDSWTCCCCTRDHDAGDELPKRTDADGAFWCADCVKLEACEGTNFADLVAALDGAYDAVCVIEVSNETRTAIVSVAAKLADLAKAFGHEETLR